jgi:hypothetical protein
LHLNHPRAGCDWTLPWAVSAPLKRFDDHSGDTHHSSEYDKSEGYQSPKLIERGVARDKSMGDSSEHETADDDRCADLFECDHAG